jgi:hypothetical protein
MRTTLWRNEKYITSAKLRKEFYALQLRPLNSPSHEIGIVQLANAGNYLNVCCHIPFHCQTPLTFCKFCLGIPLRTSPMHLTWSLCIPTSLNTTRQMYIHHEPDHQSLQIVRCNWSRINRVIESQIRREVRFYSVICIEKRLYRRNIQILMWKRWMCEVDNIFGDSLRALEGSLALKCI